MISLTTAALFLRGVLAAGEVPLGFGDPRQVLLVSTDFSFTRLDGEALTRLTDQVLDRVRALPGASAAAFATIVPLSFGGPPKVNTRVEGYVPTPNETMLVGRAVVSDGYFETIGIPIPEGRSTTRADRAGGTRVVVVNQAFADRYWPGHSAIGRRLDQGDGWATVVGVVRNAVVDDLSGPVRALVYHAFGQVTPNAVALHVRSNGNPLLLMRPLQKAFGDTHADLPVLDPRPLAEHMGAATFVQSVGSVVGGVFGLVALLIAGTGLYGLVSTDVVERRRDIAVAIAIGASPRTVLRAAIGPAIRLTAMGLTIGGGVSIAIALLIRNQLNGVAALDPFAFIGSLGVLVIVTAVASISPAWRAVRIDPAAILRS